MSEQQTERKRLEPPKDWDDLFPGRFLKAGHIGDRKPTLVIKAVEMELLPNEKGEDEARAILTFHKTDRELGLNKTNALLVRAMFGRDVQSWVGKPVTLFRTEVKSFGKMEPCIRIWGSPILTADMNVEVKLKKRKPGGGLRTETLEFTLHKTEPRARPPQQQQHEERGPQ